MKTFALAFLFATALLQAEEYTLGPDSLPQPAVSHGTVSRHRLAPGKFYPGTPHDYAVYVPSGNKPAKSAPFMVFLDGSGAVDRLRVPVVLDNLIAAGALPPLVGIFVDPGVLPALSDRAQNRYERIFEYDSVNGRFARFLLEELIPEVGKTVSLSSDPNDHAIAGVSTGAVGAFVAAWQRPDEFHRVLCLIGTFVDMKGAEELASLVRKTEPKPLRILIQDGKNDHIVPGQPWGISFAGSWPIDNQVMFEALEFAGYDAKLVMGAGAHDTKQGAAIMPEALRWLWADYPKPIAVHEPASMQLPGYEPRGRVYSIFSADKPWEQVGASYKSVAGLASGRDGEVFFADHLDNRIYRSGPDGSVSLFKSHSGGAAALRFGPDGRLYASQPASRRIVSYGPGGDEREVAREVEANDLTVTATGEIYFSDIARRGVGHIDARGRKGVAEYGGEITAPAGLALSPDQSMLAVSDTRSRFAWSLQIAADGSLTNGEPYYRLYVPETGPGSGAGGVATDSIGQVYFASALGIQVTEQNGRVAAVLNAPEFGVVSTVAFAGRDLNWLYAGEGGKVFRRPVKISGAPPWSPIKPPQPPL